MNNTIAGLLFGLLLLLFNPAFGQFTDNFSDGDYLNNPSWDGDTAAFEVNPSFRLWLNADTNDAEKYLTIPSQAINNATWECLVEMDFNPSSTNNAKIYLTSSTDSLTGPLNGYYIRIGGQSDEISLYRQTGSSAVEIIDGVDGSVSQASVQVRIRATRDAFGNWELLRDSTGGSTFVSEGMAFDITHPSSFYSGAVCDFTFTRRDKFFFDDFVVTGTPFQDTTLPVLSQVMANSTTELVIALSEPVIAPLALLTSNYSVSGGIGAPTGVSFTSLDSTELSMQFANAMIPGTTYDLIALNLTDSANNVNPADTLQFTFINAQPAGFSSVVINEVYADFNPSNGLPSAEFIEIHNPTQTVYTLANWQITDGTSTSSIDSAILYPGDYLILCNDADSSAYSSFGNVIGLSGFPTLNNSGDYLALNSDTGQLIDSLTYGLSWYRDDSKTTGGWSLERINPLSPCASPFNWIASTNSQGGTPGIQNSVYNTSPDITPPTVAEITVVDLTTLRISFSEPMDSLSLSLAGASINPLINVNAVIPNPPYFINATILLGAPIDSGVVYSLALVGATDCSGNLLPSSGNTFAVGKTPGPKQLVINEVYPNPDGSISSLPEAEFIEIYNPTDSVFGIDGLQVADYSNSSIVSGGLIFPQAYVIIVDDNDLLDFTAYGQVATVSSLPSQNNNGDVVIIRNAQGLLVDALTYDLETYNDTAKQDGGWTIERINPEDPCGGLENWGASNSQLGGTPGTLNSLYDPTFGTLDPEVTGVGIQSIQTVRVFFSKQMDSASLVNGTYQLTPGSALIDSVYAIPPYFESADITFSDTLFPSTTYTLTFNGVVDCEGAPLITSSVDFRLPAPGDVVINEVLFNPRPDGSDFVELYNKSGVAVSLTDWAFRFTQNGSPSYKKLTDEPITLQPGEFIVFCESTENIAFEYNNAQVNTLYETDLPSYANDAGDVRLVNVVRQTIDRFTYSKDFHYPLLDDNEGVSLERISYDRPSQDKTNWHSAAEDVGFATPGFQNSQYGAGVARSAIEIPRKTFSPDNDGFEDNLIILYTFAQAGNTANVRVYDAAGRKVRDLLNNELFGTAGSFSWNGITNDNEKARVGMYVLFIEVTQPNGEVKKFKESCVIATRF